MTGTRTSGVPTSGGSSKVKSHGIGRVTGNVNTVQPSKSKSKTILGNSISGGKMRKNNDKTQQFLLDRTPRSNPSTPSRSSSDSKLKDDHSSPSQSLVVKCCENTIVSSSDGTLPTLPTVSLSASTFTASTAITSTSSTGKRSTISRNTPTMAKNKIDASTRSSSSSRSSGIPASGGGGPSGSNTLEFEAEEDDSKNRSSNKNDNSRKLNTKSSDDDTRDDALHQTMIESLLFKRQLKLNLKNKNKNKSKTNGDDDGSINHSGAWKSEKKIVWPQQQQQPHQPSDPFSIVNGDPFKSSFAFNDFDPFFDDQAQDEDEKKEEDLFVDFIMEKMKQQTTVPDEFEYVTFDTFDNVDFFSSGQGKPTSTYAATLQNSSSENPPMVEKKEPQEIPQAQQQDQHQRDRQEDLLDHKQLQYDLDSEFQYDAALDHCHVDSHPYANGYVYDLCDKDTKNVREHANAEVEQNQDQESLQSLPFEASDNSSQSNASFSADDSVASFAVKSTIGTGGHIMKRILELRYNTATQGSSSISSGISGFSPDKNSNNRNKNQKQAIARTKSSPTLSSTSGAINHMSTASPKTPPPQVTESTNSPPLFVSNVKVMTQPFRNTTSTSNYAMPFTTKNVEASIHSNKQEPCNLVPQVQGRPKKPSGVNLTSRVSPSSPVNQTSESTPHNIQESMIGDAFGGEAKIACTQANAEDDWPFAFDVVETNKSISNKQSNIHERHEVNHGECMKMSSEKKDHDDDSVNSMDDIDSWKPFVSDSTVHRTMHEQKYVNNESEKGNPRHENVLHNNRSQHVIHENGNTDEMTMVRPTKAISFHKHSPSRSCAVSVITTEDDDEEDEVEVIEVAEDAISSSGEQPKSAIIDEKKPESTSRSATNINDIGNTNNKDHNSDTDNGQGMDNNTHDGVVDKVVTESIKVINANRNFSILKELFQAEIVMDLMKMERQSQRESKDDVTTDCDEDNEKKRSALDDTITTGSNTTCDSSMADTSGLEVKSNLAMSAFTCSPEPNDPENDQYTTYTAPAQMTGNGQNGQLSCHGCANKDSDGEASLSLAVELSLDDHAKILRGDRELAKKKFASAISMAKRIAKLRKRMMARKKPPRQVKKSRMNDVKGTKMTKSTQAKMTSQKSFSKKKQKSTSLPLTESQGSDIPNDRPPDYSFLPPKSCCIPTNFEGDEFSIVLRIIVNIANGGSWDGANQAYEADQVSLSSPVELSLDEHVQTVDSKHSRMVKKSAKAKSAAKNLAFWRPKIRGLASHSSKNLTTGTSNTQGKAASKPGLTTRKKKKDEENTSPGAVVFKLPASKPKLGRIKRVVWQGSKTEVDDVGLHHQRQNDVSKDTTRSPPRSRTSLSDTRLLDYMVFPKAVRKQYDAMNWLANRVMEDDYTVLSRQESHNRNECNHDDARKRHPYGHFFFCGDNQACFMVDDVLLEESLDESYDDSARISKFLYHSDRTESGENDTRPSFLDQCIDGEILNFAESFFVGNPDEFAFCDDGSFEA